MPWQTFMPALTACAGSAKLVLCGHIHEDPGVVALGDTVVVNCTLGRGGGALVALADGQRPGVKML